MEYHHIVTNRIQLHVAQAGSLDGPLVILLHGFPEFWYGWHRQIPALAAAGYRVWAPDQRGYNLSDKPDGIAAYNLDQLSADVIGLIDAAGQDQTYLVGHDWGAAVAWRVANQYPKRLKRLVVMNVPHPTVMAQHVQRSFAQLRKSWYILFFQLPWLPEALSKRKNWQMAVRALVKTSHAGVFTPDDLDRYRQAWAQPLAYTSTLNWYRAALQKPPQTLPSPRICVPTLLIWGAQDRFLGREMAQPSIDLCEDGRLALIEDATHWVHHEKSELVNDLLTSFLRD